MSRDRVSMHRLQEFVRLHRMSSKSREVARLLKMSPNTERQYRLALSPTGILQGDPQDLPELESLKALIGKELPRKLPPQQVTSLKSFEAEIERLFSQGVGPRAIYDHLRLEKSEFKGSLSAVKRLWRRLKRERGVRAEEVAIPVETAAGEVAQVDFGYVGKLYEPEEGVLKKAWVFVMVLGYSRHLFARVVFDQKVETWLRLHVEAFEVLGGVVAVVVPDNLKSAVIRAAFGICDEIALNQSYRELARHYGFKVDPTPAYSPEKKGKVEAGVKYVKRSFFASRQGQDVRDVEQALQRWTREIAGVRRHGTTGRRPLEVFEQEERARLLPLPQVRFEAVVWKEARVHQDSHVVFGRRLYSVPWRYIGKQVWIRATAGTVAVYCEDVRLATHDRRGEGVRSTFDEHLPEHRAPLRHRSRAFWEERASLMGESVRLYIEEVFDSDDVLSMLRAVQAMVTHLETFPVHRAVAACERARYYGNLSYQGLKNILRRGLDLEPLPQALLPAPPSGSAPRYARSARELLNLPLENSHEPN